jgi:hypothetical protein
MPTSWRSSVEDAARGADQQGRFDSEAFRTSSADHLTAGSFRSFLSSTIWNFKAPSICVFRSVFDRPAPSSIPRVEALISPTGIGQGNQIYNISDELLDALTDAYREALLTP